jgi:hypothetical protein
MNMAFEDDLASVLNYMDLSPSVPVSGELAPRPLQTGVHRPDAGMNAQLGPGTRPQLAKKNLSPPSESSMAPVMGDLRLDTGPFPMEGKGTLRESLVKDEDLRR